jgi:hypothetical protein
MHEVEEKARTHTKISDFYNTMLLNAFQQKSGIENLMRQTKG